MAKHLANDIELDNKYGKIISRQGVRLVYLEDRVKELEDKLVQERVNRIEDLQALRYIAESNIDNNQQNILKAIAGITAETLEQITGGIIQNKRIFISTKTHKLYSLEYLRNTHIFILSNICFIVKNYKGRSVKVCE